MQFSPPLLGILAKPLNRCSFLSSKSKTCVLVCKYSNHLQNYDVDWVMRNYIISFSFAVALLLCFAVGLRQSFLSYLKLCLVTFSGFLGPLQVQQVFTSSGAIDANHWVFPSFRCLHHLYECRHDNLKAFTFLFSEAAVGWGLLALSI